MSEVSSEIVVDPDQIASAIQSIEATPMPVAVFEGEYIRNMVGKLPSINLAMDEGYARGTHLKIELEVRIRSVRVDENRSGDLIREHQFSIEEAKIVGAYAAHELDPGVGGNAAGSNQTDDETEDVTGTGDDLNGFDPGF